MQNQKLTKNNSTMAVYIGRFRPLHNAHLTTIKMALQENDKMLILVGSCGKPRDIKNPFNFLEIKIMIESCLTSKEKKQLTIMPLLDHLYDDTKWTAQVQKAVEQAMEQNNISDNNINLYGNEKDSTSYYLRLFPQWNFKPSENITNLNATDIRTLMFEKENISGSAMMIKTKVPEQVFDFLMAFKTTKEFQELQNEYEFIKKYKQAWEIAPYPPTFVTVDAIVECCGHILLIQRKMMPGKGLWAMPRGFIGLNESIEEAMIRELKEESKINVSKNLLKGSVKNKNVFDHPGRSLRGRTITHAYHIKLDLKELPEVKGEDDACDAKWFAIAKIAEMETLIFEDHLDIISHFTGITKEFKY